MKKYFLPEYVLQSYSSCSTFWAKGVAGVYHTSGDYFGVSFETWFQRSAHFRFDFASPHPFAELARQSEFSTHFSILNDSERTIWRRTSQGNRVELLMPNLVKAIEKTTGSSIGSSALMYQLLYPISQVDKPESLTIRSADEACIGSSENALRSDLVRDGWEGSRDTGIWIDNKNVIRKLVRRSSAGDCEIVISETTFDQPIPRECFTADQAYCIT